MKQHFTKLLLQWHQNINTRTMPWKGEKDPYKIWLAEIILQQTRVEQGLPYYNNFIAKYSTIIDLANGKDDDVFKLWEGLGYYSRCRNLLFTARYIRDNYHGKFPTAYHEIITLKGVGSYTAAAIASFAYGLPYAVVDGNVYRVLARYFNNSTAIDSTAGKKMFSQLAQELLPINHPANFNQAIMDFGATVCTPKNPTCSSCILKKHCKAFEFETVLNLPIKEKKLQKKYRFFYFFILNFKEEIYIEKREGNDIWQNLHQFYLIETDEPQHLTKNNLTKLLSNVLANNDYSIKSISEVYKQTLTHQKIEGNFIEISLLKKPKMKTNKGFWIKMQHIKNYAFPKFINEYLNTT
ncbi:MAG: A/G-specific adenine glycosylase [Chitinophagaceae bacterium]